MGLEPGFERLVARGSVGRIYRHAEAGGASHQNATDYRACTPVHRDNLQHEKLSARLTHAFENDHSAVQPPSMLIFAPVMFAAASRQRNTAMAATSSGWTKLLVGWRARRTSWITCSRVMLRAFMVSGIWFS